MNLNTGYKNNRININDDEEAQMNDEDDDEPDFMDNSGKCWEYGCKIRDEKHLNEWCQKKMGGMIVGKEEKLTRQFHCQIKECQFKAIFLKACSNIYTRNQHNHQMKNSKNIRKKEEKKTSQNIGDDYMDKFGKIWKFKEEIGKNISSEEFRSKYGFNRMQKLQKTLNLNCRKINPAGGRCPFVGIYLKSNGCLYTRGEHEHSKRTKTPQNIGDDYVDNYGKMWKFHMKIGKNIQCEMLRSKFGFSGIRKIKSGLLLNCLKKGPNIFCKFVGIYLKSNECLYTRGKHEHVHIERNPKPNIGDDYVDRLGKKWPFHAYIDKNVSTEKLLTKFGFSSIQRRQKKFYLYLCCRKRTINGGRCQIKGIYLKSNGCLYIRGKHEHKLS